MYTETNKQRELKRILANNTGEVTIFFGNHQQTGMLTFTAEGVLLQLPAVNGSDSRQGRTFIFYEEITAVSY